MLNLSRPIEKVASINVLGVPAGKGLVFAVMKGLTGALTGTINTASKGKIPPYATGPLLALAVGKVAPIRNFLGPGAEVVQIVAVAEGLEDVAKAVYNMTAKAAGMVGVEIPPFAGVGRVPLIKAPPLAPAGLARPSIPLATPALPLSAPTGRATGRAGLAGEGIDEIEARLGPVSALNL